MQGLAHQYIRKARGVEKLLAIKEGLVLPVQGNLRVVNSKVWRARHSTLRVDRSRVWRARHREGRSTLRVDSSRVWRVRHRGENEAREAADL